MARDLILALDQGTTSSRALVCDAEGNQLGLSQVALKAEFPRSGWVEQNPAEIWQGQLQAAREAMAGAGCEATDIAGIGITNQRETTVLWSRSSGQPLAPAIVWQDRRSAAYMDSLRQDGYGDFVRARTGLQLDAYFTAGKIRWLLDNNNDVASAAASGDLLFGTVDSWLLYCLTAGQVHATDATNACRTLLFDTARMSWSPELLGVFGLPDAMLPEVHPNVHEFGVVDGSLFGAEIPVLAMAGDQHAATFGQACFSPGMAKNTYGTGCFMLQNVGTTRLTPESGLLGTLAWQAADGSTSHALEGSVFTAGAAIQWLRDGLGIISEAGDVEGLARSVEDNGDVYLVPAFTGLGAPHWDSSARGIIVGLSRGTTAGHIARATLESIALQVAEVFELFVNESGLEVPSLRVDGGAAQSDMLLQLQADALGVPVVRTSRMESTAYGAAFMAGFGAGLWKSLDALSGLWHGERTFEPRLDEDERGSWLERWRLAAEKAKGWI